MNYSQFFYSLITGPTDCAFYCVEILIYLHFITLFVTPCLITRTKTSIDLLQEGNFWREIVFWSGNYSILLVIRPLFFLWKLWYSVRDPSISHQGYVFGLLNYQKISPSVSSRQSQCFIEICCANLKTVQMNIMVI